MRTALESMASNTGTSSPGEELMTLKTSDVAVCCSSNSCQLTLAHLLRASNSRVFSMAMTA